ncbi:hypothetical protein BG004_004273 [Podila humilis]|nr:hypothetical protein BG004_004273 [Podila humilis]
MSKFRADLRKILCERSNVNAHEFIRAFCESWSDQKELLEYFNKNYFGWLMYDVHERQVKETQESWMLCYWQDISYASIDTNKCIESWHNTLKRHFFRDMQQRGPDTVIYVFAILAVPRFQKCMRSIVNVDRMNPAQSTELRLIVLSTEHNKTRESRDTLVPPSSRRLTLRSITFTTTGAIAFLRADFWEHQANFHPGMLEPIVHDDPAPEGVPKVDLLDIQFNVSGI